MADFCSTRYGGPPPYGDFTQDVRDWTPALKPGHYVWLGICEEHGTLVTLNRYDDGRVTFEHEGRPELTLEVSAAPGGAG